MLTRLCITNLHLYLKADGDMRESLRATVVSSREMVRDARAALESCTDAGSLGTTWKRVESSVALAVEKVAFCFRTLRNTSHDSALHRLIDFTDEAGARLDPPARWCADVSRSLPILFCLDVEQYMSDLASML